MRRGVNEIGVSLNLADHQQITMTIKKQLVQFLTHAYERLLRIKGIEYS